MTTRHEYDKKKLIILRAVLIVIGAGVGGTALWQYFVNFPDIVRREYQIVITVVSATLIAALLGLSAKPIYRLGVGIAEFVTCVASKLGAKGITGVVLGLVAAGIFVLIVDVIMSTYQDIWAVRLLVDMLAYIIFAGLCCYVFIKWLSAPDAVEERVETQKKGFLISYKCLTDVRSEIASDALINVYVCDSAYRALCLFGCDADAVRRLDMLVNNGAVKLLHVKTGFSEEYELDAIERSFAAAKRLKYVSTGNCDLNIDVFAHSESDKADRKNQTESAK